MLCSCLLLLLWVPLRTLSCVTPLARLMENSTLSSLLGEGGLTTPVVEKYPPPTECIPFEIALGIIEIIRNDCYAGDGTVNPSIHLLELTELGELFKILGLIRDGVMRKLNALSLKGKPPEWYRLLYGSHLRDWEEIQSLSYSKFYHPHEVHVDHGNYVLCDTYIVEFIHDPTENYYEKGTYAYRYFNNINFPLFMLKVLMLHLFCLPMLISLCFNELFYCNIPMHRKHVRLKSVWYLLLYALFYSTTLIPTWASLKS